MELSVKTLDSQTHLFQNVDGEISVFDFKTLISAIVTLAPEQQRLIFRGRVLQNEKKLKDYDVSSGQVLHLVGRNPASSGESNDTPPIAIAAAPNAGGNGGRNNAIIMGTIGTLDFPGSQPPVHLRRTAASVRLQVINENFSRAGRLLDSLEQTISQQLQDESLSADASDPNDDDISAALGHHAATAAAVVASIRRGQGGEGDASAPEQPPAENTAASATVTPGRPRPLRPVRSLEAPPIRDLTPVITDLIALNERVTPYLRTLQRWLRDNTELRDERLSAVQYTFNTVSAILHALSHSIHAISDISVDFTLPPSARRLRAPTSILVEQSTILRATIPVGVQFGEMPGGGDSGMGGAQVLGINLDGAGIPGAQGQAATAGLQQAIASMLQGAMFPQMRTGGAQPNPPTITSQPRATAENMAPAVPTVAAQAGRVQLAFPPPTVVPQPQSAPAAPAQNATAPAPSGPQAAGGHAHSMQSLMGSLQGQVPRSRDILLQCHSHHNSLAPMTAPTDLVQFLRREVEAQTGTSQNFDPEHFEALLGFVQILNIVHPAIVQYVQGNMLRGRDIHNPSHVLTGVRSYGRRFSEWVVGALPPQGEETTASLNSKLAETSTKFLAEAVEIILHTPAGSPITPSLNSAISAWLPKFITVFASAFPEEEHRQVIKGVIQMIVSALFPSTSLSFRAQLTAGLSAYADSVGPEAPEPQESPAQVSDSEEQEIGIVMEMDVDLDVNLEFEGMEHSERSTPVVPPRPTFNHDTNASDSEDDIHVRLDRETNELFGNLPAAWHSVVMNDIERQAGLRNGEQQAPFSAGFLSLFPQK